MKAPSVEADRRPMTDMDQLAYLDNDLAGVDGVREVSHRRRASTSPPLWWPQSPSGWRWPERMTWDATTLFAAVSDGWARMLGPVVLGFVAAVLLLERVHPAVRRPFLTRGHFQDLVYLVVYAAVVVPLIIVIDLGFSLTLQHAAPWLRAPNLGDVPRMAILVLAVLLMDAFNWLAHWSNHRWAALWRFHAVHHSQEELSVLTSFRAHPLVHTSFLISVIPVVVLSSNATIPATVITVYICLSSLPHANLPWTFGPLGKVIVSPAYHRLHHASKGRIDLNLGSVFTIWDVDDQAGGVPCWWSRAYCHRTPSASSPDRASTDRRGHRCMCSACNWLIRSSWCRVDLYNHRRKRKVTWPRETSCARRPMGRPTDCGRRDHRPNTQGCGHCQST